MDQVLAVLALAGATVLSFSLSTIPLRRGVKRYSRRMRSLQERASRLGEQPARR
jgi:hypothetical protein